MASRASCASSQRISAKKRLSLIFACALLVVLAACGGDDEPAATGERPPGSTPTETAAAPAQTEEARTGAEPRPPHAEPQEPYPEDRPGGAGDEEEARVPAQLTGRGGRITPRVVRVPPFLAIRVTLRSADGREYGLRVGRKQIRAGGQVSSSTLEIDGLRPGESVTAEPVGGGNPVRIVANAEPGP